MGVADTKRTKLYLRLPERIVEEQQIKELHPAIARVALPRQKSRRWCTVEVDSDEVKAVVKELKSVRVNGKRVFVKVLKKEAKEADLTSLREQQ
ncbi:DbpA domain containing protein [Asbolus verrucosus]|uniref:DbpA domain containing protein n=1 Tax=Asbolus verrucosus TaxID=1661398 RepID=A0A482W4H7_ASBVE|nr:DbpA domain containing protein [Asbolus verrucosus]